VIGSRAPVRNESDLVEDGLAMSRRTRNAGLGDARRCLIKLTHYRSGQASRRFWPA